LVNEISLYYDARSKKIKIILDMFSKTPQISNFMKTCPVGAPDMTDLIVAFRNSANAPKIDLRYAHTPHAPPINMSQCF